MTTMPEQDSACNNSDKMSVPTQDADLMYGVPEIQKWHTDQGRKVSARTLWHRLSKKQIPAYQMPGGKTWITRKSWLIKHYRALEEQALRCVGT